MVDDAAALVPNSNLLSYIHENSGIESSLMVVGISPNKISMRGVAQSNSATCYKVDIPPAPANGLAAQVDGTAVSLSWTDQSDNESGFTIQTKTSVSATWENVETTSADVTAYSAIATGGNNWYRIIATNGYGDSMTSNEVLVEIE